MTATQLPLALVQRHYNRQLFADYFLNTTLPAQPEWAALAAEAAPVMAQVAAIYAAYTPTSNEAQTEDGLIKPVLAALGHLFEVQATLRTPDGAKKPDYVFYRDAAALQANKGRTLDDTLLASAIAVGDAKYWDRPLDVALKTGGDPFSNKNPAYQIAFYMQHSGVTWGILTNGRRWRLYHKETAHKLDRCYEVDLPELLAANDATTFLYLYAFFRRAAFDSGPLGLASLLEASSQYAQAVGDTLKMQVYEALRHLAQGLLDHPANALVADPATLKQMYDHALIVLYRLLFIFYAEARELLPIRASADYRNEYSLFAITRGVERRAKVGQQLLPTSARIWQQLKDLFQIINLGSPPLKVATFNGGLFDPGRYPFLERYNVGDAHLQQAIDKLARVNGQFVDYRDLAERHLGTIYEGLLEYHLEALTPRPPLPFAGEGATRSDGGEGAWTIDVFNDKGQRHRTGSYYTPDFIVRYMVDQTLGPLLQRAVDGQPTDAAKIAAVLSINLIDPAMGSGHFLVEATEYIARFLVDLGIAAAVADAAHAPADETDLAYWKRRVAQSCIYGVDLNPLAVDLAKLSLWLTTVAKNKPLSFLDHHLRAGNALVGARIAAVQVGGSPRKKVAQVQPSAQISMLDDEGFRQSMSTAVGSMWLIEESAGDTVGAVKEQERIYAALREQMTRRYARLADLATASNFGLAIDGALWQPLADFATGRSLAAPAKFGEWLAAAEQIAATQSFFHYDLEFPEVFYDRHGQPLGERGGFDAVLGNPPYVRQEVLGPLKPYLAQAFKETYHGVADLYVYFYHQGLRLLQPGGRMAYIVTNKWLRAGYGEPLRAYFAAQNAVEQIIDFGHAPIFAEADVFPCILVLEKRTSVGSGVGGQRSEVGKPPTTDNPVRVTAFPREALGLVELGSYVDRYGHDVPPSRFTAAPWSLESSEIDDLMAKLRRVGVPLTEFAGVKPYYGIKTGLNEAFLIDTPTKERLVREDARSAEIIKPYLRGQDIKRWSPEWAGLWMIFARRGIKIDAYPAIKHHLLQFREQLEPRPKDWLEGTWKGRKPGLYKWYEIQDSVDYWGIFTAPKIVYQVIQFYPQYAIDTSALFHNDKGFSLPTADGWLCAVLNSAVVWWHNWRYLPHMKDEALNPAGVLMEKLPIAPPTPEQRGEAEAAVARLITLTQADQEARRDTLDWLRSEFEVETPGQKLEHFAALSADGFVAEVRKRRPKAAGVLTPATLKALRAGYGEQATPMHQRRDEAITLERRLADMVNAAYGLNPADIETLWRTAPPRMPGRE